MKPSLFKTACKAETSIPRDPIFISLLKRKHPAKEFEDKLDELDEEETDKLEELDSEELELEGSLLELDKEDKLEELDSEELELEGSLLELDKEDELEETSVVVNDSVQPLGAYDPVVELYTWKK